MMTSGDLNIGLSEKLTEIVSKWLTSLRTLFSRFSLPRLGAALDGGGGRLDASPLPTTQVSEHRPGAGLKLLSPSSVMAHSILVMGVFVTMRGPPKS